MSTGKRKRSRTGHEATVAIDAEDNIDDDDEEDIPFRNCENLFVSQATLHCAQTLRCIPCAYKIGCFDVALDSAFCRARPNQRPELCPRSSSVVGEAGIFGYASLNGKNKILTVGDGDFSFSLGIARLMGKDGDHSGLVATSYEKRDRVCEIYKDAEKTIGVLESMGATVLFGVDATKLTSCLSDSSRTGNSDELPVGSTFFHQIIWNFPCEAVSDKGDDGQNAQMENNKELVRKFLVEAQRLLEPGGEIHMNHKTKPPFNQWKIEEVALELVQDESIKYAGRIVFDRCLFPPYTPRKALSGKSFPVHDACTYVFWNATDGSEKNPLHGMVTSTVDAISRSASSLLPVTHELLRKLRTLLLVPTLSIDRDRFKKPTAPKKKGKKRTKK